MHRARHAAGTQIGQNDLDQPARVQRHVHHDLRIEMERRREAIAPVVFADGRHGGVDGEHQCLEAGILCPPDERMGQLALAPHIELEPVATVLHRRDLFDGGQRRGGEGEGHAETGRRARQFEFAFIPGEAGRACRGDRKRPGHGATEQFHACLARRHVDQHLVAHLDPLESDPVFGQADFVFRTPVEEFEHAFRQPPAGRLAQVRDVEITRR